MQSLHIMSLGIKPFREVWELQRSLQQKLITNAEDAQQTLILCEHEPVITHGKSADPANLFHDQTTLDEHGIEVLQIERGGDFTYHGPGQLVAYPILDLRTKQRDVGWYLRSLEEVVIQLLQSIDVSSIRKEGCTGVWIPGEGTAPTKKICSMGVRLSRWCSMHGLAVNLTNQVLEGFRSIRPCGLSDVEMVSVESEGGRTNREEAEQLFIDTFCSHFGYTPR